MKKVKLYTIILTMTLVTSLFSGCKQNAPTSSASAPAKGMDKSPITIKFYNQEASPKGVAFNDPVAKKITELTGVNLQIEAPVGGSNDRIPLMIASKEYPDMIYAKADSNKIIDAGGLIKLDDYIAKSPNIKALYGSYLNRLKYSD